MAEFYNYEIQADGTLLSTTPDPIIVIPLIDNKNVKAVNIKINRLSGISYGAEILFVQ